MERPSFDGILLRNSCGRRLIEHKVTKYCINFSKNVNFKGFDGFSFLCSYIRDTVITKDYSIIFLCYYTE